MPPTVDPTTQVPNPESGESASVAFLEHHGICRRQGRIPCRSSSLSKALFNPFLFYATELLGLTDPLRWSKALSRGSWMHSVLELDPFNTPSFRDTPYLTSRHSTLLTAREAELTTLCSGLGIVGDQKAELLDRERKDALSALAWYSSAARVFLPEPLKGFRQFLSKFRVLDRECLLWFILPHIGPLVAQPDILLYDPATNMLWIVDLKSCDEKESPLVRMSTVGFEFQTLHYLYILNQLLSYGIIQKRYDLPSDVRMGGMIHLVIQKPTIEFGTKDRPFKLVDFTPKSGKNKGKTRQEKEHYGEPSFDLYLERCDDWYQGVGDYEHKGPDRGATCPVNLVKTPFNSLDVRAWTMYYAALDQFRALCTEEYPSSFAVDAQSCRRFGKLNALGLLAVSPIRNWPEIIRDKGLVQAWREDHVPSEDCVVSKGPSSC